MYSNICISFVAIFLCSIVVDGQNANLVKITGKVLNAKDSSEISSSIVYEKLPYYDDVGFLNVSTDGHFTIYIVENENYNFSIRKDNFKPLDQQIKATSDMEVNFYLEIKNEAEVMILQNVVFARGSDVLQNQSFQELDQLKEKMRQNKEMIIQLEGHTDFAGNPTANIALSQARVDAVKKYLTKREINKERILTKAYGGSRPLSQERTPDAISKNRRVEMRIIKR